MTPRLIVLIAASAAATAAHAAPKLQVLNAAVRVVATTGPGADVSAAIHPGRESVPTLKTTTAGGVVTIDGGLGPDARGACVRRRSGAFVRVAGRLVAVKDLPVVKVSLPADADIRVSGAVYGEVGPAGSLRLYNTGCGDWRAGDVARALRVSVLGGGDLVAGGAGLAEVASVGSGDVSLGAVRGGLTVKSAGSGNVRIASAAGPVDLRTAGSGNVSVAEGRASSLDVVSSGSGDVAFAGAAAVVRVALSGSGGVRVAHATGTVSRQVSGSGLLSIGR